MPELGTSGSVRGASSNGRPYRDPAARIVDAGHAAQTIGGIAFRNSGMTLAPQGPATRTPMQVRSAGRRGRPVALRTVTRNGRGWSLCR